MLRLQLMLLLLLLLLTLLPELLAVALPLHHRSCSPELIYSPPTKPAT